MVTEGVKDFSSTIVLAETVAAMQGIEESSSIPLANVSSTHFKQIDDGLA